MSHESRVHLRWTGEEKFEFGVMDRPTTMLDGSGAAAPSPFDGLLGAIAACASVDVVGILEKRRTPVASLEVEVVAQRADGVPKKLTAAQLRFRITGAGIEREHALRAIELSVTKYCSVRDSLDPAIPITWTLELGA